MANPPRTRAKNHAHLQLILKALRKAGGPRSAYELIELVRPTAVLAPPTIYRALDKLIGMGSVHKIESLNAFVACTHKAHHDDAAFAICNRCGSVTEFEAPEISKALAVWSEQAGFMLETQKVEIHGQCMSCSEEG